MSRYYTGVFILSVLSMAVMCMVVRSNSMLSRKKKAELIVCYLLVIVGSICEWGAVYLEYFGSSSTVHTIVKTLELSIAPIIPIVLLPILTDNRTVAAVGGSIAAVNIVLEIISAFTGFIFYVDASNVYHHGNFYFLYISAYFSGVVVLLLATSQVIKTYQSSSAKNFIFILVFLVVGLGMHIVDSSIRCDYITISMSLIFFYIEYEDVTQSSDSLTKMLNRHSYESKISNLEESATIISMDIDDFKTCNDAYGHLHGDSVLVAVSSIIRGIFNGHGLCYRIGGDEFCIIMRGTDNDTDKLLKDLRSEMNALRAENPHLPYISSGYATYNPRTDSVIAAIEKADSMMYRSKNFRKELLRQGKDPDYDTILKAIGVSPTSNV